MLTEISFRNFRALRNATLRLAPPISVLVGPNNAGKSTALLALDLLRELVAYGSLDTVFERTKLSPDSLVSRGESEAEIRMAGTFDGSSVHYTVRFNADHRIEGYESLKATGPDFFTERSTTGKEPNHSLPTGGLSGPVGGLLRFLHHENRFHHSGVKAFIQFLARARVYHLSVSALRSESPILKNPLLSRSGDNIAAVVDWLQNAEPDTFARFEADVRRAAPEVRAVRAVPTNNGSKVLAAQLQDGMFEAPSLSDGLLLFIALAAATAGNERTIIALEEPERGVHPRRLQEVLDSLKRVANQETQILITTHSPLVLDEFRDSPESVLVFESLVKGTKVTQLSEMVESRELNGQSLGDAWYSGILGGVPRP